MGGLLSCTSTSSHWPVSLKAQTSSSLDLFSNTRPLSSTLRRFESSECPSTSTTPLPSTFPQSDQPLEEPSTDINTLTLTRRLSESTEGPPTNIIRPDLSESPSVNSKLSPSKPPPGLPAVEGSSGESGDVQSSTLSQPEASLDTFSNTRSLSTTSTQPDPSECSSTTLPTPLETTYSVSTRLSRDTDEPQSNLRSSEPLHGSSTNCVFSLSTQHCSSASSVPEGLSWNGEDVPSTLTPPDASLDLDPPKTSRFSRLRRPSLDLPRRIRQFPSTLLRSASSILGEAVPEELVSACDKEPLVVQETCLSHEECSGVRRQGDVRDVLRRCGQGEAQLADSPHTSSSWKFWRRLSTRRPGKKNRSTAKHANNADPEYWTQPRAPHHTGRAEGEPGPMMTCGSLPDVLDKVVLTRSTSLKAPPKPPRLFLCRSSSVNPSELRGGGGGKVSGGGGGSFPDQLLAKSGGGDMLARKVVDPEPIYVNSAFGAALKSGLSGNDRIIPPAVHSSSNNNSHSNNNYNNNSSNNNTSSDYISFNMTKDKVAGFSLRDRTTTHRTSAEPDPVREAPSTQQTSAYPAIPTDTLPRPPRPPSTLSLIPNYYSLPHRTKTPRRRLLSSDLVAPPPRARPKSKGERSDPRRHQAILHSVMDLMCQRFNPFPLLDSLHSAGVITQLDVQAFRGHPDRKLICEHVINAVGRGDYSMFTAFLEVLRTSGSQGEILRVLHALADLDRLVHDLPAPPDLEPDMDCQMLAEEKMTCYEVGYLTSDGVSLKPIVELERARPGDRRLHPRSSHLSSPGADTDTHSDRNSEMLGGSLPGPIMINACITGHNLSGPRALALAQVLKQHNCIVELRLGKTQLSSADIAAICGGLLHNVSLTSLDIRLNTLDGVGACAVASVLSHTRALHHLNLSSTGLEVTGCRDLLSSLTSNRSLTELDLSFLNVGDAVCDSVRDMLKANSTLRRLRLRSNNFSAAGVAIIAEGLNLNRSLLELDLSRNCLGDDGMEALARYIPESSLADVSLENCNVTSLACDVLSQMLISSRRLRCVDLSVNPLGDEGVVRLGVALERSSVLQSLALNMCGITNDGFSVLLDVLEKNVSLWMLKLCYNRLGREHLNPMATSDNLRYRLRIVTSSRPKLKILLWGNAFSEADDWRYP